MWCLNRNRSVKFKLIKTVVIVLFILAGTQFFNVSLLFTRSVWTAIAGEERIPEPVPKQKSFFGIDVIRFDRHGRSGEIPNYMIRAVIAAVVAIALAIIGMTGICNDSFVLVTTFSIAMTTIVVLTGTLVLIFGTRYEANVPIVVSASISIVTIVFAVVIRREKLLS